MNLPLVSVVIPTYNGGDHLAEAIQSIFDQTYTNFEIIIVDDVSPEDVSITLDKFSDGRIRYIRHEINKGAVAARKTGVQASLGDIIAFLDQDDLFHRQKLETHVNYLTEHPDVGLSYNGRFEVIGERKIVCGIYRPPLSVTLTDWVSGFPVSPSDAVLVRKWALMDEIWDDSFAQQAEHVIFNGQEIVFGGRLALAGCKFGCIDRALNYRRYHPYRVLKYLSERCQAELACQEIIFSDPRCPQEVKNIKNLAFSNTYIMWAYTSYMQEEYTLAKDFLAHAFNLNPSFFADDDPCPFLNSWLLWVSAGTVDYVRGHEEILRSIFDNLPQELQYLKNKRDWAITRSYLLKGLHTMLWGERDEAENFLQTAIEKGANIDIHAMNMLSDELLNYDAELGDVADQRIIDNLAGLLAKFKQKQSARFLVGFYAINRAFRNFQNNKYDLVPADVLNAIKNHPRYLLNKGAMSILIRSIFRLI
jgi:glycosyltransferase involved in cell wall biosynthesis